MEATLNIEFLKGFESMIVSPRSIWIEHLILFHRELRNKIKIFFLEFPSAVDFIFANRKKSLFLFFLKADEKSVDFKQTARLRVEIEFSFQVCSHFIFSNIFER